MNKCKLCHREKLLQTFFFSNIEEYEHKFEEDLCVICNLYKEVFGIRKRTTDFDVKKLKFVITFCERIYGYYDEERRIQQNDWITIWKNDKYFNQWYDKMIGKDTNKKYVKKIITIYFNEKGKYNEKNQLTINLKNRKPFKDWIIDNYYKITNNI